MDGKKEKLWGEFWENGDNASLNGLMNAYIEIVKTIAEVIITEHTSKAPIDNLYAEGLFALKDSIFAYPKGCPIPFEDYCRAGIKHAMEEEMKNWQTHESD